MAAATVARPTYTAGRAGGNPLQWTNVAFWHPFPLPNNSLNFCQGTILSLSEPRDSQAPLLGPVASLDWQSASVIPPATVIG